MKRKTYLLPLLLSLALPAWADGRLSCTDATEAAKASSAAPANVSFAAECRYRGNLAQAYRAWRAHPQYGVGNADYAAAVPRQLPPGNYSRRTAQQADAGDLVTLRRQGRHQATLKIESQLNGGHLSAAFRQNGGTVNIRILAEAP